MNYTREEIVVALKAAGLVLLVFFGLPLMFALWFKWIEFITKWGGWQL